MGDKGLQIALLEIGDGPCPERRGFTFFHVAARPRDDGNTRSQRIGFELFDDVSAAAVKKMQIEHDQVGPLEDRELDTLRNRGSLQDVKAGSLCATTDERAQRWLVLYDENPSVDRPHLPESYASRSMEASCSPE